MAFQTDAPPAKDERISKMDGLTQAVIALTALVTALGGLVPVVVVIWKKLSRQERRLDLFWRARLLRGTAEALARNLVVEQVGPDESIDPDAGGFMTVAVTPAVFTAYEPIAPQLVAMRAKYEDATQTEFAEAIEERFGPWLARFVCAVLGVSEYACIVMAVSIADGVRPAELPKPDSRQHRPLA
jgi:hypothetical protein